MAAESPGMCWSRTGAKGARGESVVDPDRADRSLTALASSVAISKAVIQRFETIFARGISRNCWVLVSGTGKMYQVVKILPTGYLRLDSGGLITPCNCRPISLLPRREDL